jgi:CRP/FNR family cyclic AMP-dependent transcriptional regulator
MCRSAVSSMDQTFQLFSECVLFRNLERREKEALFTRVPTRDFAANETIFATGSPSDSVMIVLRGTVQIRVPWPKGQIRITSPEGRPRVLARLSHGEIFGEIAFLDGMARGGDATAITDCTVAIVDRHDLLAFLERNPGAWQNFVSVLCERLRHTVGGNTLPTHMRALRHGPQSRRAI